MDEASDSDSMAIGFHIDDVGDRQLDTDKVSFGFDGDSVAMLYSRMTRKNPFIAWIINACRLYEDERKRLPC